MPSSEATRDVVVDRKPSVFISYCHEDGSAYADDLEKELTDYFDVKRDTLKLNPSDDIFDFMAGIADQDYVVIVLTSCYTKSKNCMLEMAYLAEQPDWPNKAMVLVIDESLYGIEKKVEVLNHWKSQVDKLAHMADVVEAGSQLFAEEMEQLDMIHRRLEGFLMGLSRRLNPSQITIVNELVRWTRANKPPVTDRRVTKGEDAVAGFLKEEGSKSLSEISAELGYTVAATTRFLRRLVESGQVRVSGAGKYKVYEWVCQ